jgi:hypothetical protein
MRALVVLIVLMLATGVAFYVVWMNRESEKIVTAVVPISVAALIGVFLSVFLFGGEPPISVRFPVVFLYRTPDLAPLVPPDRPLLVSLFEVPTLKAEHPELMEDGGNGTILYHHLLQKAILNTLEFLYACTWEIDLSDFNTGIGEQQVSQPSRDATEPSTKLTTAQIDALLKDNRFAGIHSRDGLGIALPPGSSISIVAPRTTTTGAVEGEILIKNEFVGLTIKSQYSMYMRSLGGYRTLMGYSWEQESDFATVQYIVSIQAEFDRLRSGHPKMPKYKNWVNQIISQLRAKLDEEILWPDTRQNYLFRKQLEQFGGVTLPTRPPFLSPIQRR